MNRAIAKRDADYLSLVRTGTGLVTGMSPGEFSELSGFFGASLGDEAIQERDRRIGEYRREGRRILKVAGIDPPDDYFAEEPLRLEPVGPTESRLPKHVQEMLFQLGTTPERLVEITENLPPLLSTGAALRGEIKS